MNKLLLLLSACILTLSSYAATGASAATSENDYFINDEQVEQMFASSEDISTLNATQALLSNQSAALPSTNQAFFVASDKNFVAAILLNFFLGGLGIHRLYLGTKTMTWVGYILSCGGIFGIVPLVDFIVLIINNQDISPYIDNPKFFMWGGGDI